MEELSQENIGLNEEVLFKILLQKMLETNKVKYSYMVIDNKKRKVFWK